MHARAQALFLAGSYAETCRQFVDAPTNPTLPEDVPWVVAALVFSGRVDEAELFLAARQTALSDWETIAARFFLGLGLARSSRYPEARQVMATNLLRLRRLEKSSPKAENLHEARFFAWQGVSFLRQMGCRYALALSSSRRAFEAAFVWGNPFARVLAAEHRGHMLVRVGQVSEGLKLLASAQELGTRSGILGVAAAVGVARLNYEAQFGREPALDLQRLEAYRDGLKVEDCYSRASANVELARQFLLRGRAAEARACLDEAEPFLEAHGQRRQKCSLWQRRAALEFWEGRFSEALACLDRAEAVLSPEWDLVFLLEIAGNRARCLEELGRKVPTALRALVRRLTVRTGSRVAERIALRHQGKSRGEGAEDDPLGSLLDKVEAEFRHGKTRRSAQFLIEEILSLGYLLFLPRVLGFPPGARALVLDPVPGGLLVVDGANLHFEPSGASAQVRALLLTLARQPLSRREMVEWIWGYRYHPERHDYLVHALVRRARRLLGRNGAWIVHLEGRYCLASGISVRVHEPGMASPPRRTLRNTEDEPAPELPAEPPTLSHRQILLLEWLGQKRFAAIQDVMENFSVSKATANRDLAPLLERGLVVRYGKARAARYQCSDPRANSAQRPQ